MTGMTAYYNFFYIFYIFKFYIKGLGKPVIPVIPSFSN